MNGKKLLSATLYVLFLTAVVMGAGEIFARWKGFRAWQPQRHRVEIQPEGGLYRTHPDYGYTGKTGTFTVRENDSLTFTLTHDSAGHRITHLPLPLDSSSEKRPEIWIFGCSFTHGWGVNDAETYPWLLQQQIPDFEVVNFGMDGFGTLQSIMQLEEALGIGGRPAVVVLAYGSFHDQRNVLSRAWEKSVGAFDVLDGMQYPFARLDERGELVIHRKELNYEPWPLQSHLAFVHYLESEDNAREEADLQHHQTTDILLSWFMARCQEYQAPLILAGIYQQERTTEVLERAASRSITTIDMSLPPNDQRYSVLPSDGHPNALAHQYYADTLAKTLRQRLQIP